MENFDRFCLLIESIFRQAHQDACRGQQDAADFLALYGAQPQLQGHRTIVGKQRRRTVSTEREQVKA